jgi:hypothetical protein
MLNEQFVRCDSHLGTRGRHFNNCLNVVSKSLMLLAIDGTKLGRPQYLADCNNGAYCAACELPDE